VKKDHLDSPEVSAHNQGGAKKKGK